MQKHAFIKDSLTMAIIQIDGCPDLLSIDKLPPIMQEKHDLCS